MRWLVTVKKSADLERLAKAVRRCGGEQDQDNLPVPLGDSELIVQVSGPPDLVENLKSESDVIDVYPDSDMQLY